MLVAAALLLGVVGLGLTGAAFAALARARLLAFTVRAVFALVFVVAAALLGVVAVGIAGMASLDTEEVAARIRVVPLGPQHLEATVRYPDGRSETFDIGGDDVFIDAHVVKWTPLANRLGLHTSYRLERISGRYRSLEQEATSRRTVHGLGPRPGLDLVSLARQWPLAFLFDAEYGSATYAPVKGPTELELRVSTSGLLLRPAAPPAN